VGRWVYRRPFVRVVRPKLPLTRGHGLLIAAFLRRRRAVRRRVFIRRRTVVVLGRTSTSPTFARLVRRVRRLRRVRLLRRGAHLHGRAAASRVVNALRRAYPPRRRARLRRAKPTVFTRTVVVNNKIGPIGRFRRAVVRMHRALRARLRWKPRPEEIPPIILEPRTVQSPKGRVSSPGAIRGRITGGGL